MSQSLMGEWDDEGGFNVVGATGAPVARLMAAGHPSTVRPGGATLRLPPKPGWRAEIAPGVAMPHEGMEQLPLEASNGTGVFIFGGATNILFSARPQRPFRGERVVAIVRITPGAVAIPVISPGLFIGTQLVGAELGDTPLEAFAPNAFGVRLEMYQATPGMAVKIPVVLRGSLIAGEQCAVSITVIGRSVRLGDNMRIRLAIPDKHVNDDILNAALEASTRANHRILEAGEAPSIRDAIRDGMKWKPEPYTDGEHFDLAPVAASRGWGDCDDLAPWLAAEMRMSGDEGAHAFVRQKVPGSGRWHALVRTGAGEIVDPSRWAGMGQGKSVGPAVHGRMAPVGGGAMAVLPYGNGKWAARTDLPWGAKHFSGMAVSGDPNTALIQATRGAMLVGEEMGVNCDGLEEFVNGFCGDAEDDEGGIVSGLFDDILNTALPIASSLGVPGAGLVQTLLPAAGSLLSSLTGGGGGGGQRTAGSPPPPPPPPAAMVPGIPISLPQSSGGAGGRPGSPMQAMPLPGGGHIAYNPYNPGPVIVRF